jgi:hypothetical protein
VPVGREAGTVVAVGVRLWEDPPLPKAEIVVLSPVDAPVGTAPDVELDKGYGVEVCIGTVPLIEGAVGPPALRVPDPPLAIDDGDAVELSVGNGGDEACTVPVLEKDDTVPGTDTVEDNVDPGVVEFPSCEEATDATEEEGRPREAVPDGDKPVPVTETLPFVIGNGTDERTPVVEVDGLETPVPEMIGVAVPEPAYLEDVT